MAFENADLPNIFCSYAVLSIESKDEQSQAQILSAALEVSFPPYYIQPLLFSENSHLLLFLLEFTDSRR